MKMIYIVYGRDYDGRESISAWTDESKANEEKDKLSKGISEDSDYGYWIESTYLNEPASKRTDELNPGWMATYKNVRNSSEFKSEKVVFTEVYLGRFYDPSESDSYTSIKKNVFTVWANTKKRCLEVMESIVV